MKVFKGNKSKCTPCPCKTLSNFSSCTALVRITSACTCSFTEKKQAKQNK